jgi:Family of unknown function (DUF5330)
MWFLLRMAFWLGLILIILPTGGSQPVPKAQVSAGDAVTAAKAAVDDMRQFCGRQPDACSVGSQAFVTIGQRAQAGAKMLYEFLTEQLGPNETGAVRKSGLPMSTSTTKSKNTLTASDLEPAWRGPQPRHEPHERPI